MRIAIIINPISGRIGHRRTAVERRVSIARRLIAPYGDAEIAVTETRRHAVELSRAFVARGFDVIVAWGGDGTVNEVAGPIIGTHAALAIVPSGSGDGLAGSLGLRGTPERAFAAAMSGRSRMIDVGYLGDRHFLNTCGIGFDAAVVADFNRGRRRGLPRYLAHTLRKIWKYRARLYHVRRGREVSTAYRFMISFANGREYGNHLMLAPDANPFDGWLDAVFVAAGSPWQQLWRARRLAFRPGRPAVGITRERVQSLSIGGERLECHVDGETFEVSGAVDVTVRAAALRVCGVG